MTVQDGTSVYAADRAVTSDRLNKTVLWSGTALPTNPTNEVPQDGRFLLTEIDGSNQPGIYKNTGSAAAPVWEIIMEEGTPIDSIFGDGSDGNATNPVLNGGDVKQYDNLTIDDNVTLAGSGDIVVRVKGTFDLQSGKTITINTTGAPGTPGGAGDSLGGNGGAGGANKANVIILANTITGTGIITSTGDAGSNGGNGIAAVSNVNGKNGTDGVTPEAFGNRFTAPLGGGGSVVGAGGAGANSDTTYSETDLSKVVNFLLSGFIGSGGTGGGEGVERKTGNPTHGAGGGAGGNNAFAKGANGSTGTTHNPADNSSGGGGGGGGCAALVVLISRTISAINVTLTGGTGGSGGTGSSGGTGGAGGQGSAACVVIAAVDNVNETLTGGTTKKVFGTFAAFENIMKRVI